MKSMVLTGIRQIKMIEIPDPVIVNGTDVLIQMKTVGVCGSDIHYYTTGKIGTQIVSYPFPVGHEGAGIVAGIGNSVTRVKQGDRVAFDPAMPCFECDQCLSGREHTCRKLRFLGCPGQADGCLSEYIVMPETSCFPISKKMSFEEAAISEPLAIGIYAVKQSIHVKNTRIGIFGFGPIGMSVLLPVLAQGAEKVYVTDKINERLEIARRSGAHWTGNPNEKDIADEIKKEEPLLLDVIYECCGQQDAMDQAVELIKPGGKIMIVGIPQFEHWSFNADAMRRKEITVANVRRQVHCTAEALELINKGFLDVSLMTTHRFSFEQTREAFELVAEYKDGVMKAMIKF